MAKNNFINIDFQLDNRGRVRKLIKKIANLLSYNLSSGIHSQEGSKKASGINSKLDLANLAKILDEGAEWTQSKTKRFFSVEKKSLTYNDKTTRYKKSTLLGIIKAGTRIKIPQRRFIRIDKVSSVWSGIVSQLNSILSNYLLNDGINIKSVWNNIGSLISNQQRFRINIPTNPPNTPLTTALKGNSHPLLDTGKLRKAIKFKTHKEFNADGKKLGRLEYLNGLKNANIGFKTK